MDKLNYHFFASRKLGNRLILREIHRMVQSSLSEAVSSSLSVKGLLEENSRVYVNYSLGTADLATLYWMIPSALLIRHSEKTTNKYESRDKRNAFHITKSA